MLVDGYVRVSQVRGRKGPSFISPVEQTEQIELWAELHRVRIANVFEELDESGARADRPLLLQAIERVESGDTNGIVVARLDRFGRSLIDGLEAIERIRRAGGTFVSVQDGFDIRTPTGKLVLRLMLSMAEFELDRMRANWDAARSRSVARGAHIGPCPPLGYLRDAENHLHPDPKTAEHVRELFRRRAAGAPWREIAGYLNEHGVRTSAGNEFHDPSSIYTLVRKRVYRGEIKSGEYVNGEAHEPLIDEMTWRRAQNPQGLIPAPRGKSLLAGLLRCASCRHAMSAYHSRLADGTRQKRYRCNKNSVAGRCPAPASALARDIEPYIEGLFFEALESPPEQLVFRRSQVQRRKRIVAKEERALAGFADDPRIQDVLSSDEFVRGLRLRQSRVDEARRELAFASAAVQSPPIPRRPELRRRWSAMMVDERRMTIAQGIDCVFVRRGQLPIEERCHVYLKGQGPTGLPVRGFRGGVMRPFELPGAPDWWREHVASYQRWTDQRIENELRQMLAGREEWPRPDVFKKAGHAALLDVVCRRGGTRVWAQRMGVRPCPTMFETGMAHIRWD